MAEVKEAKAITRLRTVSDIVEAHESIFNDVRAGRLDSKTADALNTTLKGQSYLLAKLRLDAAKIIVQAQIKKINLPDKYLPVMD